MIPDEIKTLVQAFLYTTERYSQEPAVTFKSRNKWQTYSYSEYRRKSLSIAAGLSELNIQPFDNIAILSGNRPEWIIADMGILSSRAVSVPLYPTLKSAQICFILKESECKVIFLEDREQFEKIRPIMADLPDLRYVVVIDPIGVEMEKSTFSFSELLEKGGVVLSKAEAAILQRARSVEAEDLASIVYTSGTTGTPKGVMLTHKNFVSNGRSILESYEILHSDSILSILPLSHVLERMAGYFACFIMAGTQYSFAEKVETVAEDMNAVSPTIFVGVPRLFEKMYSRIMNTVHSSSAVKRMLFNWAVKTGDQYHRQQIKSNPGAFIEYQYKLAYSLVLKKIHDKFGGRIRFMISGGAPLEPQISEFFNAIGLPLMEGYGLTETAPVTNVNQLKAFRIGTVGRSLPGVTVKTAEDGEILVKGPNVMKGYYKNPEATQEVFTEDGWFKTGDIGKIDEDGYLWITDRKKEMIVTSGGKNVAPQPIENLLKSSRYISQIMLIGEQRNFVSALIVPEFEALEEYARSNGIPFDSLSELVNHSQIQNLYQSELDQRMEDLPRYEQVKKFLILCEPWTINSGELTPTLKLKRQVILQNYREQVESFYR